MSFATTDLCDKYEQDIHAGKIHVLPPVFLHFGQMKQFKGQIVTVKAFEDNTVIKAILENEEGAGKVLVVDGGASLRCSLVGGNIAKAAAENGWAGIVVNGAVRDVGELEPLNIGIRALALCPLRSLRKGAGEREIDIKVQGVTISNLDWLYADADGIVVSPVELI